MQAGELIYKKYYHIGVAVDTEHGLLVPVIRDVDRKSIVQLAKELDEVGPPRSRPQTQPRRDAQVVLYDHQPRRHRRYGLLADRLLARGGDPGRGPRPPGGRDRAKAARRSG